MKRGYRPTDNDEYANVNLDVFSEAAEGEPIIIRAYWEDLEPSEAVGPDQKVFHTVLPNNNFDAFIDFNSIQVYVTCEIKNADGKSEVTDSDKTTFINNGLSSLFSDILIQYNFKSLFDSSPGMQPFSSYMTNLLSFDKSVVDSIGSASLFYLDTPGHFHETDTTNKGFTERLAITKKKFILGGQLRHCMFQQDRFFVNQGKKLELVLKIADSDFVLHSAGINDKKYKVVIHKIVVRVKYVLPVEKVLKSIRNKLQAGSKAHYFLKRPDCYFEGVSNQTDIFQTTISKQSYLPTHVVLGICSNAQRTGDPSTNPYCFMGKDTGFEIDSVSFQTTDNDIAVSKMDPNFSSEHYIRTYLNIYESLGLLKGISSGGVPIIPYKGFANGYCLFVHNLNPDSQYNRLFRKRGSLRIQIKFKNIPTASLNVIILAMYDSVLSIGNDGNFSRDWVV